MKHVKIDVADAMKGVIPDIIEKDLKDNQMICPECHGLGISMTGVSTVMPMVNKESSTGNSDTEEFNSMWNNGNDNICLFCPNCINGIVNVCEYCGEPIPRWSLKCNCKQSMENDLEEIRKHRLARLGRAESIKWEDLEVAAYDEATCKVFFNIEDFIKHYRDAYEKFKDEYASFDEYIENEVPIVLWDCYTEDLELNAYSIIEDACYDLHEDAIENVSEEEKRKLQDLLDEWCSHITGTTTYYPNYDRYVPVDKEWFNR
jgi:hypothetical protein